MPFIIIAMLTLLLVLARGDAYLRLQHARQYEAVSRDLQPLSLSYKHCHINIILFDSEVDISGLHSPYCIGKYDIIFNYLESKV